MLEQSKKINAKPIKSGTRAVVIGAGRSGIAAVRLLLALKVQVCLLEKEEKNIKSNIRNELESYGVRFIFGEHDASHFADVDYIIPSPGIAISGILPLLPLQNTPEVLAEMELAWRCLQGEHCLAITGTSGKTTTASLAAAMLEAQGLSVFLGGNIGTPLSEYVLEQQKVDVLVLEVSSFQLQTCTSFAPHVAVLLNITENHLDYHKDMQEYISAKLSMFELQKENDIAIVHSSLKSIATQYNIKSKIIWFDQVKQKAEIFAKSRLVGAHNQENIQAAWLACKELGVSPASAAAAVASFAPLVHRLESVREFDGVLYINDSKCTTTSSLKVALEAFDKPIILLCGGKFKGGDLQGLRDLIKQKVKHVALFGASRNYFEQAWQDIIPMTWSAKLDEAIAIAKVKAEPQDVVLMAPATASFDLYANYMARGDDFKRIVGALS